jgi:hypothetical protein
MATTPRQQIASPQSFTSDPLEQVFAKEFSDPNSAVGAFALANMITAGGVRERGQEQYLSNLHMTNALAAQLAQQDMSTDLLKESLQQGHHYITAGVNPSDMPLIQRIIPGNSGNLAADLRRALTQSQIDENKAKAAHAGDAGAPTVEVSRQYGTYGEEGGQVKAKGRNATAVEQLAADTVRAQLNRPPVRGAPPPPGARNTPGGTAQSYSADKYGR